MKQLLLVQRAVQNPEQVYLNGWVLIDYAESDGEAEHEWTEEYSAQKEDGDILDFVIATVPEKE